MTAPEAPSTPPNPGKVIPFEPRLRPEAQQNNYQTVAQGFLNRDKSGSANLRDSACGEAFSDLWHKSGNPEGWTDADMQRPEVQDLVMTYRTFGMLADGRPLTQDEVSALSRLLDRQQAINELKVGQASANVNLDSALNEASSTASIEANQAKINKIRAALKAGIPMENTRYATDSKIAPATWATPEDMGKDLTTSVIALYDYTLRRTDTDRATDRLPNEPVRRPMTEEEKVRLNQEIQQMMAKAREEAVKRRLKEQMDNLDERKAA